MNPIIVKEDNVATLILEPHGVYIGNPEINLNRAALQVLPFVIRATRFILFDIIAPIIDNNPELENRFCLDGEVGMAGTENKRAHERFALSAPMVYAFHDSDQFHQARLCNYCEGGMCFLSGNALDPGSDIYIMMEEFATDSVGAEFYDGYLAEVRWCRKTAPEHSIEYFVGVKYYQTIIK